MVGVDQTFLVPGKQFRMTKHSGLLVGMDSMKNQK